MQTMIANERESGLQKSKEFFLAQIRLLENPMFEQRGRNVLVVSLLMVNVETRAQ
jgi:hypothetical protein